MEPNLPLKHHHFTMQNFFSMSSSPHVISCHHLPFNYVQSGAMGIVHVELTHHKDKHFIGYLNSTIAFDWSLFSSCMEGERRWWSRSVYLLQQHISPKEILEFWFASTVNPTGYQMGNPFEAIPKFSPKVQPRSRPYKKVVSYSCSHSIHLIVDHD